MSVSRWCLCQRCAGVVSLTVQASLQSIVVVAAFLSYPVSLSSTASTNILVCDGHLWHCAGIVSLMALASSPLLRWLHHPYHAGVCPLVTLWLHVALSLCWCCCPMRPCCRTCHLQPCCHMQRCCHAGFVFVCSLVAIHGVVVVIYGGQHRSAMPPAAAVDGLGSGNA
jgi:hypothetical protein